jgi:endonuclease/exonuclease/phosphatase family metal-dependent hydrolase
MAALSVATYNVCHAALREGRDGWDRRRSAVVARLRDAGPDVVGLQECEPGQLADVAAGLPGYTWAGSGTDARTGENNPVGVGPRVDLVDAGTTWLSASGARGSVGWDADYPRVLTAAHLRLRSTGTEFAAFNTHFSHTGPRARAESAALLRRRIDALPDDRPAVATGDFNARPGRTAYGRLVGDGFRRPLVDVRAATSDVTGPDTTLSDFEDLRPGRRVDHVFVTPEFDVDRYAVDATTADGRFPSDHLPVAVDLSL